MISLMELSIEDKLIWLDIKKRLIKAKEETIPAAAVRKRKKTTVEK